MSQVDTSGSGRRPRTPGGRRAASLVAATLLAAVLIPSLHVFVYGDRGVRRHCIRLTVVSSPDKARVMERHAGSYEAEDPSVAGTCVDVRVAAQAPATTAAALVRGWNERDDGPAPDVWTPDASVWLDLVGHRLRAQKADPVVTRAPQALARSAQVVALPRPMALELGWPARDISWADLADLAGDPDGWGRYGRPEWGPFRLGKADPALHTPALAATGVAYLAGAGAALPLTLDRLHEPAAAARVRALEASVEHYGVDAGHFLEKLREAGAAGEPGATDDGGEAPGPVSAVVVDEQAVWDHNTGSREDGGRGDRRPPPDIPLAAVYPAEGTPVADHPYAVLALPWVDAATRRAASDFLAFLRRERQQRRFQQAGFRNAEGEAGPEMRSGTGVLADGVRERPWPDPTVTEALLRLWPDTRKRATILVLLDTSASMERPLGGRKPPDRLALVRRALLAALGERHPGDEVGLWTFPVPDGEAGPYREAAPVGPGRQAWPQLTAGLAGALPVEQEGPVDDVVAAALDRLASRAGAGRITGAVLVTDADGTAASPDPDPVLTRLLSAREAGVRLWVVFLGKEDAEPLAAVADAAGTRLYQATGPREVETVVTTVLSNF